MRYKLFDLIIVGAMGMAGCAGELAEADGLTDETGEDSADPTATEHGEVHGSEAALTSAGGGRFQAPNGLCIVPTNANAAMGSSFKLGDCGVASSHRFTLAVTKNNTAPDGVQGRLKMGDLCVESDVTTKAVWLAKCNGTALQEWTWNFGHLTPAQHLDKCVSNLNWDNGSPIAIADCASSDGGNKSFLPIDFNLMFVNGLGAPTNPSGPHPYYAPPHGPANANLQCLDVWLDFENLPGTPLDNFQCNRTNAQWFHFDANNHLLTTTGNCIGAASGASNAALQVQGCNNSDLQKWILAGSMLANGFGGGYLPQFCADVKGESPNPLTPAVLSKCVLQNKPLGQTWYPNLIWPAIEKLEFASDYFDIQEENGQAWLTVWSNGWFVWRGQVHDYGFWADDYVFDVSVSNPPAGTNLVWTQEDTVSGTCCGADRDSTWLSDGWAPALETAWDAVKNNGVRFNFHVATNAGDVLSLLVPNEIKGLLMHASNGDCDAQVYSAPGDAPVIACENL
ncbi:MAG: ricin-type beta-trefoil lectin domain protein [Myxococcales bacterium]